MFFILFSEFADCRDKDSNGSVVSAEFDASTKFFAACTDCKQFLVWNVEDEWKLHSRTFVAFSNLCNQNSVLYLDHCICRSICDAYLSPVATDTS